MLRRKSRQRERIYTLIAASNTHPTAQAIYDTLRRDMPTLSLGNVYRNLKILIEEEQITKRDFGDNIEHFDAITGIHYHFICEQCGNVDDFGMPIQSIITKHAQKISEHIIKGHNIEFFGTCKKCVRSKNKISKQAKTNKP